MQKSDKEPGQSTALKQKKYPTEKLLKSKHLSEYQRDFAKVLLTEKEYTIAEAKESLDRHLKVKKER